MPKNTKKRKNTKNTTTMVHTKRELIVATEDQCYCKVNRMLGDRRVECEMYSGETKIGLIRKKLAGKKRGHYIQVNDIVLVSLRDFQDGKVDILHLYKEEEIDQLLDMGESIPQVPRSKKGVILFADSSDDDDDGGDYSQGEDMLPDIMEDV